MEDLSVQIKDVENRAKSNTHRIEQLEQRQDKLDSLVQSVAVMAKEQEHIKADVAEIRSGVSELQSRSGKRWDAVVDKVLLVFVTAVMAFLLAKIGL